MAGPTEGRSGRGGASGGALLVVSLRSRGMLAFNTATFFDIRHQCISFSMDFYDVFSAFVVTILSLSWSAWISVAIAIVATAATLHSDFAAGSLEEIFPFFMYIVLPLLLTLSYVCDTRTRAAMHLAVLKSMCTALCLGRPEGGTNEAKESAEQMQMAVEILIKDVHAYLAHKRPYAHHFFIPYRVNRVTATHTLVKLSRDLGMLQRKVHTDIRVLHHSVASMRGMDGISDVTLASLQGQVTSLHAAVEQLMVIKEMRTPMVLRATIRWFAVVIMPCVLGPYWNHVSKSMRNKALSGSIGVLTQIALMALVDTAVGLEDPFDETALDALSLIETGEQLRTMVATEAGGKGSSEDGTEAETGSDHGSSERSMDTAEHWHEPGVIPVQEPDPIIEVPGIDHASDGDAGEHAPKDKKARRKGVWFVGDVGQSVSVYVPPPMPMPPKPANEAFY